MSQRNRKTGIRLTAKERREFFELIDTDPYYGKIIRQGGIQNRILKHEGWTKVTEKMQELTGKPFTSPQLQKVFHNRKERLQRKAKKGGPSRAQRSSGYYADIGDDEENDSDYLYEGTGDTNASMMNLKEDIETEDEPLKKIEKDVEANHNSFKPLQVKWIEYEMCISQAFREMREEEENFDVTLVCENDYQVKAHKVILSACSPFFRKILKMNPHPHPLLYLRNVRKIELDSIMDYMYVGRAIVPQNDLPHFLKAAGDLKIKGLITSEVPNHKRLRSSDQNDEVDSQAGEQPLRKKNRDESGPSIKMEAEFLETWLGDSKKTRKNTTEFTEEYEDDIYEEDDDDEFLEEEEENDEEILIDNRKSGKTVKEESSIHPAYVKSNAAVANAKNDRQRKASEHAIDTVTTNNSGETIPQPSVIPEKDSETSSNTCNICGQDFGSSAVALMVHKSRDHPVTGLRHNCKLCQKTFNGLEYLEEHMRRSHSHQAE